jgi:predicted acylesterase/phospholipase RssA
MSSTEKFHKQRALVFQGGGALGAYEAGVYFTSYGKFLEREGTAALQRNLFNIIVGS